MSNDNLKLLYRGSTGLRFVSGPPHNQVFDGFSGETSPSCKDMAFSKDGEFCAWCNGENVKIISTGNYQTVCSLDKPKAVCLAFSPKGTYVCTWEQYSAKATPQESCNLHIWNVKDGRCVKSFIQKKQSNWCPEWTDDEHLCARNVNNEVHFFENSNFDQIANKIHLQKVASFGLAPGPSAYHAACYVPGSKGQPSFVRLFKYPVFEGPGALIAQKSFFKADRAEYFWNKNGKDILVQAAVEVDKSGGSYYGEQNLFYLNTKGDTANVILGKHGPIYAISWHPNNQEFGVVYGYMPAKATIYNLKCDPLFDFGTGPRNEIHFTFSGSRMILCGFGNLRGHVEVWDMKDKKKVTDFTASDSTMLSWSPDGEYILTATTSPRLRVGNGYKVWHYTGSLLCEEFFKDSEELWDMMWQPLPEQSIKSKPTQYVPVPGIQSSQPQASKQAYRPPGARGQPSTFKLHDDEPSVNSPSQSNMPLSKSQKRKLAKKAKKEQEDIAMNVENKVEVAETVPPESTSASIENVDKEKRIRALLKKLDQIKKIKEDQKSGKSLDKNQIEKMSKEKELLKELSALKIK